MALPYSEPRAIELIPASTAKKFDVAPLTIDEDGTLVLAAVNEANVAEVGAMLDRRVRAVPAALDDVLARIGVVYPVIHASGELAEMHPLVRDAIRQFVDVRGHDLQFEVGPRYGAIKIAVKGHRFVHQANIPREEITAAINSFSMRAGLDINRSTIPRDGRYSLQLGELSYEFRLASSPTMHGHWLTVRGHNSLGAVRTLEERGMRGLVLDRVKLFAKRRSGMFLVTGPIGEGKTSLFYSLFNYIFDPKLTFRTAEQPVEVVLDGVGQVEIREGVEPTFDQIIRSWVREYVDVFGIGELRDLATILAAIQAALLGHRLFATAHANDALRAMARLRAVDKDRIDNELLVLAFNAISNQRLLYTVCTGCAGTGEVPDTIRIYARQHALPVPQKLAVASEKGCKACGGTGYEDRTGVFEVLDVSNDDVIDALLNRKGPRAIAAADPGFEPMVHDAVSKVIDGITTVDELDRVFQFTVGGASGSVNDLARTLRLLAASSRDEGSRRTAAEALASAGIAAQ